jgi:RNA polymerase sigma-70 factor, ECF subfamily
MNPKVPQPFFEQVAADLSPPLLRYLRRYTGSPQVAEDLLQETLLRISDGLARFEGRSSVKTWAFSIATHAAADHYRNPASRASIVDITDTSEPAGCDPSIEDRLIVDEMNACVRQVIDSLPESYRSALILHDLEGLSAAETADISGCTLATAKIRIHRARNRLAEALRRECDFYRDGENVLRCDQRS